MKLHYQQDTEVLTSLAIRQAMADQVFAPQRDEGSLKATIERDNAKVQTDASS